MSDTKDLMKILNKKDKQKDSGSVEKTKEETDSKTTTSSTSTSQTKDSLTPEEFERCVKDLFDPKLIK